jgi:hypothetical protein
MLMVANLSSLGSMVLARDGPGGTTKPETEAESPSPQ